MKKVVASVIALICIFSSVIFASGADVYTCPVCNRKYVSIDDYNACLDKHDADNAESTKQVLYQCPVCGKMFPDLDSYNECVDSHYNNIDYHYDKYVGQTVPELLASLVEIYNKTGTIDTVQDLIDKLYELTTITADKDKIFDTISDIELKTADINLDTDSKKEVSNLINNLRDEVKNDDLESKITVEVTEAEQPAETGSSATASIVVFSAISIAFAVAYITIKKK